MEANNADGSVCKVDLGAESSAGAEHTAKVRPSVVHINVHRPIYSQNDFNRKFEFSTTPRDPRTVGRRLGDGIVRHFRPSVQCLKRSLLSLFPFVGIMKDYTWNSDFLNDVIAGLTVGVMHVPQGMAYGMLANVDPVYGLYTSFFPVILYFLFGTSRHISIGTFAVISLMIGTVVAKSNCAELYPSSAAAASASSQNVTGDFIYNVSSNNDNSTSGSYDDDFGKCKLGVAVTVSLAVGIYQILMGVLKLGFVTIYLSDPLTRALTMAAAVHVFTSQVKPVFGVDMGRFNGPFKLIYMYTTFFKNITRTNVASLVMAVVCIVFIYCVHRWLSPIVKKKIKMPVPAELIVIIFGTLVSSLASMDTRFHMKIVGNIPTGIPYPSIPPLFRFTEVAGDAVGIAIVAFTISISMSKLFAKKHNYPLDSNQELLAYGITNATCSTLNCYVSCASLSRSFVQEGAGAKTQMTGIVSCGLLLVVFMGVAPLFRYLPNCVLAAIVVVNLKGAFMQITDVRLLYRRAQYYDLATWVVTAVSVVLSDVDVGLFFGIGFSVLSIVFRTQRPHNRLLGRIPETDIYEDIKTYPRAREIPGIKIFSFTSSLYYANAEYFMCRLYKKSGCNPEYIKAQAVKRQRRLTDVERRRQREVAAEEKKRKRANATSEQDQKMITEQNSAVANGNSFAAAAAAAEKVDIKVDIEAVCEEVKPEVTDIILECSSLMFIDSAGVSAIRQVIKDYKDIGVQVYLACCREPVFDLLDRAGVFKKAEQNVVYVAVHDAVLAAVKSHAALFHQLKADVTSPLGSVLNVDFCARVCDDEEEERMRNGDGVGFIH